MDLNTGLMCIGAGIGVLTGAGAGVGIGIVFGNANTAIARQPEIAGKVMTQTILGAALAESTAIYGLVVSLIILFVK